MSTTLFMVNLLTEKFTSLGRLTRNFSPETTYKADSEFWEKTIFAWFTENLLKSYCTLHANIIPNSKPQKRTTVITIHQHVRKFLNLFFKFTWICLSIYNQNKFRALVWISNGTILKLSPSRSSPGRREKINLNFYFQTSLWCLERFYEDV